MANLPVWQAIPTQVSDAWSLSQKADDWAKDQYAQLANDWGDAHSLTQTPTPSDNLTNPLGTGNAMPSMPAPEPATGASAPPTEQSPAAPPSPSPAGPAPVASTIAPDAPPPTNLSGPIQRQSQFGLGLSSADAMAFCGPTAAIAFAQTYGRNPTVDEAKQLAKSVGWTPEVGMAGVGSEQALLTKMGVQTKLEQGINWDHVVQDANNGNPVIIDTPGHYFYVTGARQGPNGTEFNVGTSGTDLRRGATWMSAAQMSQTMGAPRAALYVDHPLAGGPSQAEKTPLAQVGDAVGGFASAVGQKAQDVVQAVQNVGKTDQPGPPIQGDDYISLLPGGTQNPMEAGLQAGSDFALGKSPISPSNILQGAENAAAPVVGPVAKAVAPYITGTPRPDYSNMTMDEALKDAANTAIGASTAGAGLGGEAVRGSKVLQDAFDTLKQYPQEMAQPIMDWANQALNKGTPASEIGSTVKRWMEQNPLAKSTPNLAEPEMTRLEPEIAASIGEKAGPTEADLMAQWQTQLENMRASRQFKSATPAEQTAMVSDAQREFQTEQTAGAGGGTPPPPPVSTTPPSEMPQPGSTPPLNTLTQQRTPLAAGTKLSSLPPEVQQAFKEWAATVGPDSNAARVAGQQARRTFDETGSMFKPDGTPFANADEAEQFASRQLRQQAQEKFDQVLINAGLRNGPVETTFQNGKQVTQRKIDPVVQKLMDNVTTPSAVPSMPILGGLQRAQQEIKGVIFPLSMFHAYTEGLYSTFSRPGGARDFAATFLSKSPTEAAQQTPMWLRAAQAGVTHLYDTAAFDASNVSSGMKGAAIRAGIGGVGGAGGAYAETKIGGGTDEEARQNALVYGLIGAGGAAAAKPLLSDNLWRAVQYSKVKTFETLVNSGVEDQVASAAVNRTFGGLNYAQMARNQTFQDLLRLTVQAPDWNESTARQLGAAFFGRDAGASFSRQLLARTVAGTAFATEILNMVFTGHPSWENEDGHQAQVQLPSGTADKPVYVGIGPGNLQAYADLVDKIKGDPSQSLERTSYYNGQLERKPGDIPDFALNRLASVPAAGLDLATGGATAFGGTKAPLATEIANRAAPVSVSTAVGAQEHGMSPAAEALLLAAGANPRYGQADKRPIRGVRGAQTESSPLDFVTKLFSTGQDGGRTTRPKR